MTENSKKLDKTPPVMGDSKISKELAARELARRSLLHYILRFNADYLPGWFHEDLCRRLERFLEDVRAGKEPRLMLWVPPRHGKSRTTSEEFPTWALGKYPDMEFITCSYGVTLPLDFSRKVRARMREEEYLNIFEKTRIDPEHQNVEGWTTTEGGGYRPAGVGGGITGKGADILLIDDPFKDAEEADSDTVRQSVWDWWGSTAYTRLSPNSGVLIIQTRWHDDDLSGRLIEQMRGAMKEVAETCEIMKAAGETAEAIEAYRLDEEATIDKWEVISYPAIAVCDEYLLASGKVVDKPEPGARKLRAKGEALHPARYSLAKLRKKKRTLQPRHWSALFQQNPVPDEGEFFTKSMIHYAPTPDWRTLPIIISGDTAVGLDEVHDFTVLGVGCLTADDKLHLIKVVRDRMDTFEIVEAILNLYAEFKCTTQSVTVGIERGPLYLALWPVLERRMKERKLYPPFDEELKPVHDKMIRARPLQGRMRQGMFCLPPNQPWTEPVEHELLRFPGGVNRDCVDMLAWMARMLVRIHAVEPKPRKKRIKSWKTRVRTHIAQTRTHGGGAMAA